MVRFQMARTLSKNGMTGLRNGSDSRRIRKEFYSLDQPIQCGRGVIAGVVLLFIRPIAQDDENRLFCNKADARTSRVSAPAGASIVNIC
jgi:hypothetical protein